MAGRCSGGAGTTDSFCSSLDPSCNSTDYNNIYCCPFGDGQFIGTEDGLTGIFSNSTTSSCPLFTFPTYNDFGQPTLKTVINATAQSPWVRIGFQQFSASDLDRNGPLTNATVVTTGNISQPGNTDQCSAVIKSFQFGWGSVNAGNRCSVTILDEKGAQFDIWAKRIATGNPGADGKPVTGLYRMKVQFGWYITGGGPGDICGQNPSPVPNMKTPGSNQNSSYTISSPVLWFMPELLSCHFEGGKFIYTLEGIDITTRSSQQMTTLPEGSDSQPMFFTTAVMLLGLQSSPPFRVRFLAKGPDGQNTSMKFATRPGRSGFDDNCLGPKHFWVPYNKPPLSVIQSWLNDGVMAQDQTGAVKTVDKKVGISMNHDPAADIYTNTPQLVGCEPIVQATVSDIIGSDYSKCFDNLPDVGTLYLWANSTPQCQGNFTNGQINSALKAVYAINAGNCLYRSTLVLTQNGWNQIDNIVKYSYNGQVACINEEGQQVWAEINNWYRNKLDNRKLIKVHLHNSKQRYGSISGGIFTDDHPILTNNGYIKIKDLSISEHKVHSGTYCPSNEIQQAIIGMILGDGYISHKSFSFHCAHSSKQKNYIEHKAHLLGLKTINKNNKKYPTIKITSKASPYWRSLRKLFYPNGIKIINNSILENFSIISLAYLHMDDGHLKEQKKLIEIATCGFTSDEVDLLIRKISDLGITCYRRKNNKYPRIYFDVKQTEILSKKIAPYIVESMNYKILSEHRNIKKNNLDLKSVPFYDTFDLIRCMKQEIDARWVYCIDVDKYHNFITHSGVVHNCSPVISFNPVLKWNFQYALGAGGGNIPVFGTQTRQSVGAALAQCPTQGGLGIARIAANVANKLALFISDPVRWIQQAISVHQLSNLIAAPIEAELRVQGDPSIWLCSPWYGTGKFVGIIFVNPFFLQGINDPTQCSQFQQATNSLCNTMLTNKGWLIRGVDHQIKEGTYVTTLKIYLQAPGSTLLFAASPPTNYGGDPNATTPTQANYFGADLTFDYGSYAASGQPSPVPCSMPPCPAVFIGGGALCDNNEPGTSCGSYITGQTTPYEDQYA